MMLQEIEASDKKPLLVAGPIVGVASLLLTTRHNVLGAVYHRNTDGLRDTLRLLYSDADTAKEVVKRRGVDALVVCANDPFANHERNPETRTLYDELMSGSSPPWLDEMSIDDATRVYWVKAEKI